MNELFAVYYYYYCYSLDTFMSIFTNFEVYELKFHVMNRVMHNMVPAVTDLFTKIHEKSIKFMNLFREFSDFFVNFVSFS